jgi:hypothetical protein
LKIFYFFLYFKLIFFMFLYYFDIMTEPHSRVAPNTPSTNFFPFHFFPLKIFPILFFLLLKYFFFSLIEFFFHTIKRIIWCNFIYIVQKFHFRLDWIFLLKHVCSVIRALSLLFFSQKMLLGGVVFSIFYVESC